MLKFFMITFLSVFFLPALTLAYIPPTLTILEKTAENSGSGVYTIEQEVRLSRGSDQVQFKETWIIEDNRTMRLSIAPSDPTQRNQFRFQAIYSGGNRWVLSNEKKRLSEKVSDEFSEKWFFFKKADNFAQALVAHNIIPSLPPAQIIKKTKTGLDFSFEPEKFTRLSRAQGVVNYNLTDLERPDSGSLWIEQDQFVIRKLKWPTQAVMQADDYKSYVKNLRLPEKRSIQWSQSEAQIHVVSVNLRPVSTPSNPFQLTQLDQSPSFEGFKSEESKKLVEEFFKRFR
jgi:hypothetical protein